MIREIEIINTWFIYWNRPSVWRRQLGELMEGPAPPEIEGRARELLSSGSFSKAEYAIAYEMDNGTWKIEVEGEWLGLLYEVI